MLRARSWQASMPRQSSHKAKAPLGQPERSFEEGSTRPIVDSVPELRFDASPKVPTITEEDFAAAARLATENRRPEFCYIAIPPNHPFYGRQYEHYSPQWLRETSLGNVLSEADWKMKCLSIGARSDESKTKFWAWNKTSQLEGLGTKLDFPHERPKGSIYLSCKSVKVQKSENELVFVEEPKMRIVDKLVEYRIAGKFGGHYIWRIDYFQVLAILNLAIH